MLPYHISKLQSKFIINITLLLQTIMGESNMCFQAIDQSTDKTIPSNLNARLAWENNNDLAPDV